MAFDKITADDTNGKGVVGLPDTPQLSTGDMQKKFEEVSSEVIIPHFNKLIEDMENEAGASELGAKVPEGFEAKSKIQSIIDAFAKAIFDRQEKEPGMGLSENNYSAEEREKVSKNTEARHSHENKSVLDALTSYVKQGYDRLIVMFSGIENVSDAITNSSSIIPTGKAVVDYVEEHGGGGGGGGVIAPVNGFFTMYVDSKGDLYVQTIDGATMPPFRYDNETGNLYWDAP